MSTAATNATALKTFLENRPDMSAAQVGRHLGIAPQTVGRVAKKIGVHLRNGRTEPGYGLKVGPKPDAVSRDDMTASIVRRYLTYDSIDGSFRWARPHAKIRVGQLAGTLQHGYWMIHLCGVDYHAHRLAWIYTHGKWPCADIDHINGDRLDNRICNLRCATRSQNNANRGIPSHNTSGFKGVSFNKGMGRWHAYIKHGGRRYNLGYSRSALDAANAYDSAAVRLFGAFAKTNASIHGRTSDDDMPDIPACLDRREKVLEPA